VIFIRSLACIIHQEICLKQMAGEMLNYKSGLQTENRIQTRFS